MSVDRETIGRLTNTPTDNVCCENCTHLGVDQKANPHCMFWHTFIKEETDNTFCSFFNPIKEEN